MTTFISRFTPSLMESGTLEALFVQRGKLAAQVLEDIRHSATTPAKHYHLLIGPRGLGKTHFVAVMKHRVEADPQLANRLRIAWLREEERGITTFLDLTMRILSALAREYRDEELLARIQQLYNLPVKQAERASRELLTEYIGERTLLLLMENIDDLFLKMKTSGQQSLRTYLQEQGNCTILATATVLFNGVSLHNSPFYGFFTIHHLQELTLEEAIELLVQIAETRMDHELATFIRTTPGRARIRALHHIAGGNHRIYIVFSEFLTKKSLDELVTPFMRMLDDLTPYYQSRIDLLSPQQQQIIEYLAHAGGAQPVKAIAHYTFMLPQTAATQIRTLKERGYLQDNTSLRDKRETYYELQEPLLRLCFEVKEYRGGPIRLFVDVLRNWYTSDELHELVVNLPIDAEFTLACLHEALSELEKDETSPQLQACIQDLIIYLEQRDWKQIILVLEELYGYFDIYSDIDFFKKYWIFYMAALTVVCEEDGKNSINIVLNKFSGIDKFSDEFRIVLGFMFVGILTKSENKAYLSIALELYHGYILAYNGNIDDAIIIWQKALDTDNGRNELMYNFIIYFIQVLTVSSHSPATREALLHFAKHLASTCEQLIRAVSMLEATVRYLNTGDNRPLLALPLEYRKLVMNQLQNVQVK